MRGILLGNAYGKPIYSLQSQLFQELSKYGDLTLAFGPMPDLVKISRIGWATEEISMSDVEFTHIWFLSVGVRFQPAKMMQLREKLKLIALEITHRKALEKSPIRWREVEYYCPATQNLARLAQGDGIKSQVWYPWITGEIFKKLSPQVPKYDVVFAGTLHGHPDGGVWTKTLQRLAAAGLSILHLPPGLKAPQGPGYIKLLRRARVGLHVTELAEGVSRKLPEYAAADVCPLMKVDEDSAAVMEPGVEAIDLNAPDAIDIIRDHEECRKRAAAARIRALKDHTVTTRVAELMEFVGE